MVNNIPPSTKKRGTREKVMTARRGCRAGIPEKVLKIIVTMIKIKTTAAILVGQSPKIKRMYCIFSFCPNRPPTLYIV
jgi:hypothetical protein